MKNQSNIVGWIVFLLATAWLVAPVFEYASFYTNDGPAHLYNSVVLKQSLTGDFGVHTDYLELNKRLEPNWLGHALLVLLLNVSTPLVAEKLLVALYVLLFMFGFRYLAGSFNKQATWSTLVAAPLVYSFPLHIGFYNFCLGLVLLFFTLGYWLRSADKLSYVRAAVLTLLFVVGFFSHVTTFLLTLACIGVFEVVGLFARKSESFSWSKEDLTQIAKRWAVLLLTLVPTLALTLTFLNTHGGDSIPENTADSAKQWADLMALRPITVFSHFEEEKITVWLFFMMLATFVAVLLAGNYNWSKTKEGWSVVRLRMTEQLQLRHAFLMLSVVFLCAYFILPDWMASGGYVHVRLQLLFILMLLLWVVTARVPRLFILPIIITSLVVTSTLFESRKEIREQQNDMVHELLDVVNHIPEGSMVLPVIENHHWFFGHAGNYLGALKPLVILDNYEADAGYFPLVWKLQNSPTNMLGFPVANVCGNKVEELISAGVPVDVIVHYADGTKEYGIDCQQTLEELEIEKYNQVYTSKTGLAKVYVRR